MAPMDSHTQPPKPGSILCTLNTGISVAGQLNWKQEGHPKLRRWSQSNPKCSERRKKEVGEETARIVTLLLLALKVGEGPWAKERERALETA